MTGFDYVLLLVVGIAAIGGFMRGFVEEILSLVAWAASIVAIRFAHAPLTEFLSQRMPTDTGAGVLAFTILLLIPYFAVRIFAQRLGTASRNSMLGPIDRVLGFGFGAIKGLLIVVLGFSVLVLGYDVVWGPGGRPTWISQARTYPLVNASSEALVTLIAERRHAAVTAEAEDEAPKASADKKSGKTRD
jgi:membrane protein required for colicin V production